MRRKDNRPLSHKLIKELVSYDRLSGKFTWNVNRNNGVMAGDKAGYYTPKGYVLLSLLGEIYLAHRIAWYYVHGSMPVGLIDHINGNPGDNRISNLRIASHLQNCANRRAHNDSKSGIKGVCWCKRKRKWTSQIKHNGKIAHLGMYTTKDCAAAAYDGAARIAFGAFARLNGPVSKI